MQHVLRDLRDFTLAINLTQQSLRPVVVNQR
jgi:hypothetical protein